MGERGGVTGNVGFVSRARKKVYEALKTGGGAESVENWEDEVFGEDRIQLGVGMQNVLVWIEDKVRQNEVEERSSRLKRRQNAHSFLHAAVESVRTKSVTAMRLRVG